MSDLWLYTPEICDGDYCPMDCDKCYKAGEAMEAQAEDKRMAEKEYIEREAFRREIDEHRPGRSYEDAWALTILDFIPSADVRPVARGKWLNDFCGKGRFSKRIVQCSLCGNFLDLDGVNAGRGDANYCPNCGADMREES